MNSSSSLEDWDPMREDYEDELFNSYDKGPGRFLPNSPSKRKMACTLFIRGLSPDINENGVRNLLLPHGSVKDVKIKKTAGYATNLCFVTMATMAECSSAIQNLNNKQIAGYKIHVQFGRIQEQNNPELKNHELKNHELKNHELKNHELKNHELKNNERNKELVKVTTPINGSFTIQSPELPIVREQKPPADLSQPTVREQKPPADLSQPSVREQKPPAELSQPTGGATRSPVGTKSSRLSGASSTAHLPLYESLKVRLVGFHSPARFSVQIVEESTRLGIPSLLDEPIECSLYGILSSGGNYVDNHIPSSISTKLRHGELYSIKCMENNQRNSVLFYLTDGSELGDALIEASLCVPDPECSYKVTDSIHLLLKQYDVVSLRVEPTSVEGVDAFYAQFYHDSVRDSIIRFTAMEPLLTEYGDSHTTKDRTIILSAGDFVLAPFEDCWCRGQITAESSGRAVVGFIDFGNLGAYEKSALLPLPRQFSHLPAISVKVNINGITDFSQSSKQSGAAALKELLEGDYVAAVVKDMNKDTLSVSINIGGDDLAEALLSKGFAKNTLKVLENSLFTNNGIIKKSTLASDQERTGNPTVDRLPVTVSKTLERSSASPTQSAQKSTANSLHQQSAQKPITSPSLQEAAQKSMTSPSHQQAAQKSITSQSDFQAVQKSITSPSDFKAVQKSSLIKTVSPSKSPVTANLSALHKPTRPQSPVSANLSALHKPTLPRSPVSPEDSAPERRRYLPSTSAGGNERFSESDPLCTNPRRDAVSMRTTCQIRQLLKVGDVYDVRLRKLDARISSFTVDCLRMPSCMIEMNDRIAEMYRNPLPVLDSPKTGDFAVVCLSSVDIRRCLITRVSTQNRKVLVRFIDYEEEDAIVSFEQVRHMLPEFRQFAIQSPPICILEGITEPDIKNRLLTPFLSKTLQMRVINCKDMLYSVEVLYGGTTVQELVTAEGEVRFENCRAPFSAHQACLERVITDLTAEIQKLKAEREDLLSIIA